MSDRLTDAPERIFTEPQPYDFAGYSPCWVWHSAEGIDDASGLTEYVRADLLAAMTAERDAMRAALAEALSAMETHQLAYPALAKGYTVDAIRLARAALGAS